MHAIDKEVLEKTIFPLSKFLKAEVRTIAKELQLPVAQKKDSTGICFIGERKFKSFLKEFLLARPGDIKTLDEEIIGHHDGIIYYTLGQRQGLKIGGLKNHPDEAWYIVDKNVESNILYVAQGDKHPRLYARGLKCGNINWLLATPPQMPLSCTATIRYRQVAQSCLVSSTEGCVMFSDSATSHNSRPIHRVLPK